MEEEIPVGNQDIQGEQLISETPQVNIPELLETYDFFANTIKANITIYNGIKLALEKLTRIEEKILEMELKLNGNQS